LSCPRSDCVIPDTLIVFVTYILTYLQADYVTVVEDMTYNVRKILSLSSSLPLLAKINAPCGAICLR